MYILLSCSALQLVQDSMTTFMRLLPFGFVEAVVPEDDPYWGIDGNTSLFNRSLNTYADAMRAVQLNSTTIAWVTFPGTTALPKISVRVPIFLGESICANFACAATGSVKTSQDCSNLS